MSQRSLTRLLDPVFHDVKTGLLSTVVDAKSKK